MGAPAGSSGTGTGSTANVYTPMQQPRADQQWWDTFQPLLDASAGGGVNTPAGQAYSQLQPYGQMLGNTGYLGNAIDTASRMSDYGTSVLQPAAAEGGGFEYAAGKNLLNTVPAAMDQASVAFGQAQPLFGMSQGAFGQSMPLFGQSQSAFTQAQPLFGQSQSAFAAAPQLLDLGYDPLNKQYGEQRGQSLDASNVANSMAGLGKSPYGASVTSNALGNFDSNWQNQKLNRANQGAQGYGNLESLGGQLAGQGFQGMNTGGQLAGQGFGGLKTGGGLATEGGSLLNTGGSLLGTAGNLTGQGDQAITGSVNLGMQGAQDANQLASAPYQTQQTGVGGAATDLGNIAKIGTSQYALPEDAMNSLQSYMKLGQSASGISGELGNMGQNQLGNSLSGFGNLAGTGSNLLFGSNSGGLVGGTSGLFGGGDFAGAGADFGGGGAAMGVADVTGGGFDAASLAPLALS